jgi:predicted AAA+ superfamily ATPase
MNDMKELYLRLCMTGVFRSVIQKPLFTHFADYCRDGQGFGEKIRAYSAFVSEIYENGGSLTELVERLVYEDENVYIKSVAHKKSLRPEIVNAAKSELCAFGEFAALKPQDFKADMAVEYVAPFASKKVNMVKRYGERLSGIEKYGYGIFSSSPMFRLADNGEIEPIISADKTTLEKFVGYSDEREKIITNTECFIESRPAANALLYGDAGTGKSSTVKAVVNAYFGRGLRLIELRKDQLRHLPYVMGKISENPLKFIIFIDDLSFNQNDDNFSMLKAALEGSASAKAANAIIYATSNRRHIVRETFADRDGGEVHRNDTMQENLSLSERFGLTVMFSKPDKKLYLEIVSRLADRNNIQMDRAELAVKAEAFALRKGNRSARCAEQFIDSLL